MDKKCISPNKILFFYGIIGASFCFIVNIISSFIPCDVIDKDKYRLSDYFCKVEYENEIYVDNIRAYFTGLNEMNFDKTDPTLYSIFKDLSNKDKCSWPKFAYYANVRMTDRQTEEGLLTIFNLFIDNPTKRTITFETFRRICNEIEFKLSEKQMKEILQAATRNGNEITFEEFVEYMAIIPEEE